MEDRTVVAHDCRKTKKIICGMEGENVQAHGCLSPRLGGKLLWLAFLPSPENHIFRGPCLMACERPLGLLRTASTIVYKLFTRKWIDIKEYGIEGKYKWRGPPYDMIIHALQTVLHLNEKYLSDLSFLNISYSTGVPSANMYNHMVWRAASFVSPFYSILLDWHSSPIS